MIWNRSKSTISVVAGLLLAQSVQAMTLNEALDRAVKHDPLVPYSLALYAADQELGRQVTGQLRPSVSLTGNYTDNDAESESMFFGNFTEGYKSNSFGLNARQALYRYDWSARGNHADALNAMAEIGQLRRKNAYIVRIAERYFAVLNAQDALRLAESEANAFAESLADTRKRHEVGLVPGTDLKEAQARNDLAQARLILARQQVLTAQDALDETTGNGHVPLPVLPVDVALPALQPKDIDAWVKKALETNVDVQQARKDLTVAEAQLREARAELMPRLDAVASYRDEDNSESRVGSQRTDKRLGLELTVPIYQGGIQRARTREAVARLDAATANLRRMEGETERLARQQYRELEAAYAQEAALKLAVASAKAAEEATRHGYKAGTRTITDVLNARSAMISAQRDYSRTRYDLLLGRMQLKQLTAELDRPDFAEVDGLLKMPTQAEEGE